jgi:hypothetical protein
MDDETFADSKGKRCEAWAQFGCDDGVTNLTLPRIACGYTDPDEIGRIRDACPLSCGLCNAITAGGDPVLKYNGQMVKMDLEPQKLTLLLDWTSNATGDSLSILGSTLAHPTMPEDQWFNHIELRVNKVRVLKVTLEQPDAEMNLRLDGKEVAFPEPCKRGKSCLDGAGTDQHKLLQEFASSGGHLTFTWSEMKHRRIGSHRAKKVLALFGDLGVEIVAAKAAKFEAEENQTAYAHLNLKVLGQFPSEAHGTFAELVKTAKAKRSKGSRKRLAAWSRIPTSVDGKVSKLVRKIKKTRISRSTTNISAAQLAVYTHAHPPALLAAAAGSNSPTKLRKTENIPGIFDKFCPTNPEDNSAERKKYVEGDPYAEAALRAALTNGADAELAPDDASAAPAGATAEQ